MAAGQYPPDQNDEDFQEANDHLEPLQKHDSIEQRNKRPQKWAFNIQKNLNP